VDENVEPWEKRMRSGLEPSVAESPLVQIWQTAKAPDPSGDVAREMARIRDEHAAEPDEPPPRRWARVRRRV